jgi:hypothetical protein
MEANPDAEKEKPPEGGFLCKGRSCNQPKPYSAYLLAAAEAATAAGAEASAAGAEATSEAAGAAAEAGAATSAGGVAGASSFLVQAVRAAAATKAANRIDLFMGVL